MSVVIPTKDRPVLLRRCLDAVLSQDCDVDVEVIVVNDAGCRVDDVVGDDSRVTVVEGPGRGPAAARNAGIARAAGEVVLFTDDDAVPQPGWIQAAVDALSEAPEAAGVVGTVESPPFDPLYEHSVHSEGGVGNFLTCNAAYRRHALVETGGFDARFRHAHEDRDLGLRLQRLGAVLFVEGMVVVHPPRAVTVREVVRRGRFIVDDPHLHAKHPQTRPPRWSARWGPLVRLVRHWQRLATEGGVVGRSPRRAARFATMAVGQVAVAAWTTVRAGTSVTVDPGMATGASRGNLRIAWVGPVPQRGGAVAGVAWTLVEGLASAGCELDCFLTGDHDQVPAELWALPGVRVINFDTGWRFDRWYSNHAITKVLTGQAASAYGRRRLASQLAQQHSVTPYDVIYQFSTIESFGLRPRLHALPPLVLHPETHAAGELRAVRAERHLAARCEPAWRRRAVEALLAVRARRQRRDIHLADSVLAISRRFGEHLVADYGIDPSKITVVPNPIDVGALRPARSPARRERHVAYVGRISARKGIDSLVELSHRLADTEDDVVLDVVGAETLWSDYRPLLEGLHPGVGRVHGHLHREELAELLAGADVLVHPATFEPFGLTVGEALACGVPVVVSDEVGAAEDVSPECCIVVPAGDVDALEKGVREMLERVGGEDGEAIRRRARMEAERLFSPERIAKLALDALAAAAAGWQVRPA